MKLAKFGWVLSVCAAALIGCESSEGEATAEGEEMAAEGEAAAEGEGAAEGEAAAEGEGAAEGEAAAEAEGPAAVCAKLVDAWKAKDAETITSLSTEGAGEALNDKVLEAMAKQMAEASCGEEAVDGETATVKVTVGEDTRDIPFAKAEDAWKFDHKAYAEKYPPAADKSKKKKKGKKGKKRKTKK